LQLLSRRSLAPPCRTPPLCARSRKPHLQGRFSGRLATKEDEKKLLDECKLLGPLLGGAGKRGDKSRLTLAKIVRGIASGDVRKHCQERESRLQVRGGQVWQVAVAAVRRSWVVGNGSGNAPAGHGQLLGGGVRPQWQLASKDSPDDGGCRLHMGWAVPCKL
jgi:hypothetical protein